MRTFAAETRYRHDSGTDYDAKAAAALGARVIGGDTAGIIAGELVRDYAETLRELYAERRRQAAPPQLAEPDRPRLPQSAYADALSRLEDSDGTDLTKPVSAYSAPPSAIELPETLHPTAPAPAPQSALADIYKEAYNTINFGWRQASGKVGDGDGYSKITDTYHIDSNNGVRISQKLNGFEEKYRTSEIEHSLVISSNGIAYEVSGISGAVNTELVGADALEGSTIIHNHPVWDGYDKGDSFSLDDLLFAARNRAGKQYLSSGTRKDAFLYTGTYNENDIRSAYHKARQEILKRAFETGEPIQFEQEEIMRILGKYLEGFEYYENIRF